MPHYFFDIRRHNSFIPDTEGSDLPDLAAAQREAQVSLQQLLADSLRGSDPIDIQQIEITDAAGQILAVVQLEDTNRSLR